MNLPDLSVYRKHLEDIGLTLPLPQVPFCNQGLLSVLPKAGTDKTGWPWTEEVDPGLYDRSANWPKLSIVTPSYNQENYLEETIRSVLLQNYPNLEFIIFDGGSTDNSFLILEKYAPWLSYYRSAKDGGQGNAINMGFSIAGGEYWAWLNSDDLYMKTTFLKVVRTFITKKVDIVYGYGYNKYPDRIELVKLLPLLDFFLKIPSVIQPSTFWSRRIHQPIWEELHCAIDYELWLRLIKGNSRKLLKEPLSAANIHIQAKTSDPKMDENWHRDHLKMWSPEGHGTVYEWKKIVFWNRVRLKLYRILFNY